jgi:hypothetical protein
VTWNRLSRIAVAHGGLVEVRLAIPGQGAEHDAMIPICDVRCRRAAMPR